MLVDELFPAEGAGEGEEGAELDEVVTRIDLDLVDDYPASDPRWAESVPEGSYNTPAFSPPSVSIGLLVDIILIGLLTVILMSSPSIVYSIVYYYCLLSVCSWFLLVFRLLYIDLYSFYWFLLDCHGIKWSDILFLFFSVGLYLFIFDYMDRFWFQFMSIDLLSF